MFKAAVAFIAALTFLGPSGAFAEDIPAPSTNATCETGYLWMYNEEKQTPCLVAAYLISVCHPGFSLSGLVNGEVYPVPGENLFQVDNCSCSSVVYSLVAACSTCQGQAKWPPWSVWKQDCTLAETSPGFFPEPLPQNTSVPQWAFHAIPPNGTWDIPTAEGIAASGLPDAVPAGATPSSAAPTSAPTTSSPEPAQTSNSSSGPNTPAIVGGVIGGLVTIGLGILGIILAVRCTRRQHLGPVIPRSSFADRSISGWASTTSGVITTAPLPSPPLKLYNPDDPSTYPSPPPDSTRGSPGHHRLQTSISSVLPEVYA